MRIEDLLPKKAVKINEKWEIDIKLMIMELETSGLEVDPKNSKAAGKLLKTYSKDKQLFGVIEFDMDVTVTSLKQGGMEITAKAGSKLVIHTKLETAIDGSKSEQTVNRTIDSEIRTEVGGTEVAVTAHIENKDVSKPVKK